MWPDWVSIPGPHESDVLPTALRCSERTVYVTRDIKVRQLLMPFTSFGHYWAWVCVIITSNSFNGTFSNLDFMLKTQWKYGFGVFNGEKLNLTKFWSLAILGIFLHYFLSKQPLVQFSMYLLQTLYT